MIIRCPVCGDKSWQCERCKKVMEDYIALWRFEIIDPRVSADAIKEHAHKMVPKDTGEMRR